MTPTRFVTGVLLLIALSVLIQLAIGKWRYEKRKAREREEAARARRDGRRAAPEPPPGAA